MKSLQFLFRVFRDGWGLLRGLPKATSKTTAKKRILIFNWRDTRHVYTGGAEVYLHEVAKRLVHEGYSVTWFCGNDGMSPENQIMDGVQIIRRGGFYFVYIWAFFYYLFKFRGNYDLVIDCENGIPFFTPWYVKEKKYLMVFHVHQEVFKMSLFVFMSRLASYIEGNVMPQVYKNIPCITIAESAKKEMKEMGLGAAGITVINPGISLEEYIPGKKAKEPTILFVGRLKQYKSIQTVLYAFKKILESVPEARCIIAGDGEERKRLKKLSVKLGIVDSILFTAKVSEKKKIQLYQQAWLVMNASVKEGWGITSLEANACGTPVVASNVAGLKDSVKNGYSGLLVKYGDSNAFAEAALHLIKNSEDRKTMSANAVAWAKQFPWEKTVKELEALLN